MSRSDALGERLRRPINWLLDPVELAATASGSDLPRPIFILGAPRSGTTLFYQLLTLGRQVGYFSNRHCRWFGAPLLVERRLGRAEGPDPVVDFSSDRGLTTGTWGAAECARFWYRWFPRTPHRLRPGEVADSRLASLRRVVGALSAARDRPFLFKVLTHSLRVELLARLFPEARFLVMHRPTLWTAQSILQARQRTHGTTARWWSIEPPGHTTLRGRPPEEQVTWQVTETYRIIDEDAALVGRDRFLHLDYSALCADPAALLAKVDEFLAPAGLVAGPRHPLPASFPLRDRPQLDGDRFTALERVVEQAPDQCR